MVATGASATRSTASAAPCWKALLNDWYDGRIDNLYPLPCYRQAINHLPTDIRVYSSAHDDIDRALAVAIAHKKNPNTPVQTVTDGQSGSTPGRTNDGGPIPSAIDSSSPGGADSFPLPLLILGGLALFLLAAGAVGLVVRRTQGRGGGDDGPPATP